MAVQIDILLAVKDDERHLTRTLESLLNQTYSDFRFIAVDDGSADRTPAILDAYAARDPRLIVIHNPRNLGLAASLNKGLELCEAPLVARADSDDLHRPDRLARQLEFMKKNPAVGVLGTGFNRVTAEGEVIKTIVPPVDHEIIHARQNFMNSFLHPSVMCRTDLIRRVGGYDTVYFTAEDSDLWVRLRDCTRFGNLPEVLVDYRVHPNSMMGKRDERGRLQSLSVPKRLLSRVLGRELTDADAGAIVDLYQGFHEMSAAEVRRAIPLLRESLHALSRNTPPEATRYLRREAARSCFQRMEMFVWSDRSLARSLLATATLFAPGAVLHKSAIRALLPRRGAISESAAPDYETCARVGVDRGTDC